MEEVRKLERDFRQLTRYIRALTRDYTIQDDAFIHTKGIHAKIIQVSMAKTIFQK